MSADAGNGYVQETVAVLLSLAVHVVDDGRPSEPTETAPSVLFPSMLEEYSESPLSAQYAPDAPLNLSQTKI